MKTLLTLLLAIVPFVSFAQPILRNPATTNRFMNLPSNLTVPFWNAAAGKWSNATASASGGGDQVWTNEALYARLVGGSTNSLKVMTNGLYGIVIGDTNRMHNYFGWPIEGLTFISMLDGTDGHNANRAIFGYLDSNTNGVFKDISVTSGGIVYTEANTTYTNGQKAFSTDFFQNAGGGFLQMADDSFSTQVGLAAGDVGFDFFGGGARIFSKWGGATRFASSTNGALTLGATTNHITFGSTNAPPASAVAPTRWISVLINGEATQYKIPLYQ